jgi:HTH-type transcriptional regulator/antitoxin MqsA
MGKFSERKKSPHLCLKCGGSDVQVEHFGDSIDFKGLELEVHGLAHTRCRECGHVWSTDGQEHDNLARIREAFAVERDRIRSRDGLLTGEEIEGVLRDLGLSRAQASSLFGGGPNAFSKYISGEVLQSFPMNQLLRLTLAFGPQAVKYLALGPRGPLKLNAGGYFLAPDVNVSTNVQLAPAPAVRNVQFLDASASSDQMSIA